MKSHLPPWLLVLRPHQWLKNLLVFVPLVASHRFEADIIIHSLLAFIAFSFTASAVYVVNDVKDVEADRAHPRKRFRPFASGALPVSRAPLLLAALLVPGFAIAIWTGILFAGSLILYLAISAAYSYRLKGKPILDVCILAGLYTWRIVAGGLATGITLSVWLLAFSIFFFLALAAVKRQAELVDRLKCGEELAPGRGYHVSDLPIIAGMAMAAGYVSVLVMALYVNSPHIADLYKHPAALWGVCLVLLYWISHVVLTAHRGLMHDDPLVFALRDGISRFCVLLMAAFLAGGTFL